MKNLYYIIRDEATKKVMSVESIKDYDNMKQVMDEYNHLTEPFYVEESELIPDELMGSRYLIFEVLEGGSPHRCTENIYWEQLECLPPEWSSKGAFAVGEPTSHNQDGEEVYHCFYVKNNNTDNEEFWGIRATLKEFKAHLTEEGII